MLVYSRKDLDMLVPNKNPSRALEIVDEKVIAPEVRAAEHVRVVRAEVRRAQQAAQVAEVVDLTHAPKAGKGTGGGNWKIRALKAEARIKDLEAQVKAFQRLERKGLTKQ